MLVEEFKIPGSIQAIALRGKWFEFNNLNHWVTGASNIIKLLNVQVKNI
jgi:hypothetical protein